MRSELVDRFGRDFPEGTVIFREGDLGEEMFIIHEGIVNISKKAKNAEQVLATLKDGDFFGEMALFTDQERSATATARVKSVILKIDKTSFDFMLKNNVGFAHKMIKTLCERLRQTDKQIEELLVLSKETRILKALDIFWKKEGRKDASGEVLLIAYEPFLNYIQKNLGISMEDAKKTLLQLKQQSLLNVRQDTQGANYIAFSAKVFDFFAVR
ncbi:MAG: cyclic nucleotide-binding domain-containing protein [Spirochaetia bacterium]|nr:cyclic nucleotide-binding domain-containing protein [Spirochaetia bacterium]